MNMSAGIPSGGLKQDIIITGYIYYLLYNLICIRIGSEYYCNKGIKQVSLIICIKSHLQKNEKSGCWLERNTFQFTKVVLVLDRVFIKLLN